MNKKKFIVDNTCILNKNQKDELIKIVNSNNLPYMENSNGIFITLNDVTDHIIDTMYEHIEFCLSHREELNESDNFQTDNLKYIQEFIEKTPVPPPIIIGKTKKNVIKSLSSDNITLKLTLMQKDIIRLSKKIKII